MVKFKVKVKIMVKVDQDVDGVVFAGLDSVDQAPIQLIQLPNPVGLALCDEVDQVFLLGRAFDANIQVFQDLDDGQPLEESPDPGFGLPLQAFVILDDEVPLLVFGSHGRAQHEVQKAIHSPPPVFDHQVHRRMAEHVFATLFDI